MIRSAGASSIKCREPFGLGSAARANAGTSKWKNRHEYKHPVPHFGHTSQLTQRSFGKGQRPALTKVVGGPGVDLDGQAQRILPTKDVAGFHIDFAISGEEGGGKVKGGGGNEQGRVAKRDGAAARSKVGFLR